jgi:hypothetical protein
MLKFICPPPLSITQLYTIMLTVSSLWGFSKICDAHGGSVRVGNYALYTCIAIYIFFTIYWVNGCSNVHVYVEISLINGVVLEFTTVLLLSIFICRFYGTTGSCGVGIYIAQKCLTLPFFVHKNTWHLSFSTSPPLPCN